MSKLVVCRGPKAYWSLKCFSSLKIPGNSAMYCIKSVFRQSSKLSPVLSKAISRHPGETRKHGLRSYMHVMICHCISEALRRHFGVQLAMPKFLVMGYPRMPTYYATSIEAQDFFCERISVLLGTLYFHQSSCATHMRQISITGPWASKCLLV